MEPLSNAVEILLVEDNPDDAGLTIRALKKHNLANNLLHLHDGEEALNFLFSEKMNSIPKVILLDLKMPKVEPYLPHHIDIAIRRQQRMTTF